MPEACGLVAVIASGIRAVVELVSVTFTANENEPAVVGVPLMIPLEVIDKPLGRFPLASDQV
jgi:hypothetical protein